MTARWRGGRSSRRLRERTCLKIGTIADLIRYRLRNERSVERMTAQPVQTELGEFRCTPTRTGSARMCIWRWLAGLAQRGAPARAGARGGHAAGPSRHPSRPRAWTLRAAMERIARAGNGVIVILRDRESPR